MSTNPGDGHGPNFWNHDLGPHGLRDGVLYQGDDSLDEPLPYPHDTYPPELVGRFHRNSDVDSSTYSQHHTLGSKHTQGSPGDHFHDGGTSKVLYHIFTGSGTTDVNGALVVDTGAPFATISAAFIQFDQTGRGKGPVCTGIYYDTWTSTVRKVGTQWYNAGVAINTGTVFYRGIVYP
jgi:hypothetical protein